jgi:hypothetical protein
MNIERLLNKFYEGDSSPEEERFLTEYFLNEENMDERWKEDRQVFRLLHDTQIHVSEDISKRLTESIMETFRHVEPVSASPKRAFYYWISSAAAIALLCIGLFFTIREPAHSKMADTFTNPEDAAMIAEQTIAFISAQLNKGLDKVLEAEQEFEKINQVINKHLNK